MPSADSLRRVRDVVRKDELIAYRRGYKRHDGWPDAGMVVRLDLRDGSTLVGVVGAMARTIYTPHDVVVEVVVSTEARYSASCPPTIDRETGLPRQMVGKVKQVPGKLIRQITILDEQEIDAA